MPGRLDFELLLGQPQPSPHQGRPKDAPVRFLVISNFSGHDRTEAAPSLQTRRIDDVDDAFGVFSPQVRLPVSSGDADNGTVQFAELDDFHPDALYRKLPIFQSLRDLRQRLLNPATFAQAAAQLKTIAQNEAADGTSDEPTIPATATDRGHSASEQDDQTLQRLLGREAMPPRETTQSADQVGALIENLVAPYIVPDADPLQSVYIAAIDEAIAAKMREVLHSPQFQAMESTWRGLDWLISEVEIGESLEIHVLDISRDQLRTDLSLDGRSITDSALYRLLVESGRQTTGGQAWSALVADMAFGPSAEDVDLLATLASVAAHAGGPLLAGASSTLAGCEQLRTSPDPREWAPLDGDRRQRWDALRTSPLAPWIGLALPRVLCRLPYGSRGEEIDAFPFEELLDPPQHEALLWGNPAIACLVLLGRSALHNGWPPNPQAALDLDGLPALTIRVDGEIQLYPCGEVYLVERAVDELLDRGLMPLVSFRNRNALRLVRLQSVANPPTALRFN